MGGEFEDKIGVAKIDDGGVLQPPIELPVERLCTPRVATLDQPIRYHVKDGKIHFHNDGEKLKVEVPVAEWWGAWEELKNFRRTKWQYIDSERGTLLEVSVGLTEDNKLDAHAKVSRVAHGVGTIFTKLDEFTTKQRAKK
jgi:hypothetical protein